MAHRNYPRNFLRPRILVAAGIIAMTLVYQLTGVTPVHSFFGVDQPSQQSPIRMSELAAAADPPPVKTVRKAKARTGKKKTAARKKAVRKKRRARR